MIVDAQCRVPVHIFKVKVQAWQFRYRYTKGTETAVLSLAVVQRRMRLLKLEVCHKRMCDILYFLYLFKEFIIQTQNKAPPIITIALPKSNRNKAPVQICIWLSSVRQKSIKYKAISFKHNHGYMKKCEIQIIQPLSNYIFQGPQIANVSLKNWYTIIISL